jgi:hypothetical protein
VFGERSWFHYGRGYRDHILMYGDGPTNRVWKFALLNSSVLRQVMTLGVMHADIGSVEWQGDRFHVRSPQYFQSISGLLTCTRHGLADCLRVTYSNGSRTIDWIIRYAYQEAGLPAGIPSRISCFWINDGREIEQSEFAITTLKYALAPQSIGSFTADPYAAVNDWQTRLYTNDLVYLLLPGRGPRRIEYQASGVGRSVLAGGATPLQVATVYTLWAGANLCIFVLVVRMKRTQQAINHVSDRKVL